MLFYVACNNLNKTGNYEGVGVTLAMHPLLPLMKWAMQGNTDYPDGSISYGLTVYNNK